jgi:hypothetical protein
MLPPDADIASTDLGDLRAEAATPERGYLKGHYMSIEISHGKRGGYHRPQLQSCSTT